MVSYKQFFANSLSVIRLLLTLLQYGDSVAATRGEVKHFQSNHCFFVQLAVFANIVCSPRIYLNQKVVISANQAAYLGL